MNVTLVDEINGGGRTPEQEAEIGEMGRAIAEILSTSSCYDVLMDVVIGAVISAAVNSGADEEFVGDLVASCILHMPTAKANRDARMRRKVN